MVKYVPGVAVLNREGVDHARLRRLGTEGSDRQRSVAPSNRRTVVCRNQRN